MSKIRTVKTCLSVAVPLLLLSACTSPDEYSSLDDRVGALESRFDAADARASQMEAAANQCTASCQEAEARASADVPAEHDQIATGSRGWSRAPLRVPGCCDGRSPRRVAVS